MFQKPTLSNQLIYMMENNLTLIDPLTGYKTKWGFFDPERLNNGDFPSERSLFSMEILSYLTAGIYYAEEDNGVDLINF